MIRPAHTHQRFMVQDDEPTPYREDCPACTFNLVVASPDELVHSPNAKSNAMWDRARSALSLVKKEA